MASIDDPATSARPESPSTKSEPAPKIYRLSVRQYLRGIDAGALVDTRLELLSGILVRQMGKSTRDNYPLIALPAALRAIVPDSWLVLNNVSLRLGRRSRSEPDLIIVSGPVIRYKSQDPHARETPLVIELAGASYEMNRGFKWRRYAAAKIPVYWIINLNTNQVEVFREPTGAGSKAAYGQTEIYGIDALVPVIIAGVEVGRIAVRDVLPELPGTDQR